MVWDDIDIAVRLYRGSALLIFFIFLIGLNLRGWRNAGCDYKEIFQLDKNAQITEYHLWGLAAILGCMWTVSVLGFLYAKTLDMEPYMMPLFLALFSLLFMLNPTNTFSRSGRAWALGILCRIFLAPFCAVNFADFWMADQLMSIGQVLLDLKYCVCFYLTRLVTGTWPGGSDCLDPGWWVVGVVAALPAWFRVLQCIRNFRDSGAWFPHLANAGKYLTSLAVVALNVLKTNYKSNNSNSNGNGNSSSILTDDPFLLAWLVVIVTSSLYGYVWDVKMDWRLMQQNAGDNKLLRHTLLYRHRAYYYFALVVDLVLRFGWLISMGLPHLLPVQISPEVCLTIFSALEIFRRFVWNFFRLENEQLTKFQKFHAHLTAVDIDNNEQQTDDSCDEDDNCERQLRRHSELLQRHEQLLEEQRRRVMERQRRLSSPAMHCFRPYLPSSVCPSVFSDVGYSIDRKPSLFSCSTPSTPSQSTPLLQERPLILGSSYGACGTGSGL